MRSLNELGLRDDTLVFFTSDNGPAITSMHPHGSAGPLRDKKAGGSVRDGKRIRWLKTIFFSPPSTVVPTRDNLIATAPGARKRIRINRQMVAEVSFQNVIDGNGIGIAVTGLSIVFVALALISTFIALVPLALDKLSVVLPPERDHQPPSPSLTARPEQLDEEIVAAIGFALHSRLTQQHLRR